MPKPIELLNFRPRKVVRPARKPVQVPTGGEATDAMFVVLRRMRAPFIFVIVTFSINVGGLMLMPGVDADGNTRYLTLFDSFYQMAITLTTVGYSEIPYAFSYPQRMWLTLSIFTLVIAWAYGIGVLLSAVNASAFQDALRAQRFRRQVRRLREPFLLICGYGQAGRAVGLELDDWRRRFVVIDKQQHRVDSVVIDATNSDIPAVVGDCHNPAVLGLAGLDCHCCQAVLALTDDDDANLAVVMTASLLRADVTVIARCHDRAVQHRMEDFGPAAVINPDDRYGGYLALLLHQPITYQLLMWLMDNDENHLPELRIGLTRGRWVVCGHGEFAEQVTTDLRASGLSVDQIPPTDEPLSLEGVVGFVAGSDNDMTNIAMAEHARLANPAAFVSVRQQDSMHQSLLAALDVDSVFVPTDLVARETLARLVHPSFWRFIEEAVQQDEAWSERTRDRLLARCGPAVPERDFITLSDREAPAVTRWLTDHDLTLGDLLRHHGDRSEALQVVTLLLMRGDELILTPGDDVTLRIGDQLLLAGKADGLSDLSDALFSTATIAYIATGQALPSTWIWRALTARRRASSLAR